jgi:hypothetical protein
LGAGFLGFGFGAELSPDAVAAVLEEPPSLPSAFFAAAGFAAVFFFLSDAGFDSVDDEPGAGGRVPV